MSGPGLMDWLNSIMVTGTLYDFEGEGVEKAYCPHPINRGIAQNMDAVMFAQEINKKPWLDKEMQYRFLVGSISKKKRYGKWAKKSDLPNQTDLDAIMERYQISLEQASQYASILSTEAMEAIHKSLFKGGSDKVKGKKS